MRFTVSDFPAKGNELDSREIVDLAYLSEQVGIDRFGITDFPFHQDCVPLMTACLVRTSRLEIESLVTTPFLRPPDVTACTWATMAELSEGRAILGIGKGGVRPPVWVAPWGFGRPNARVAVRELIGVCRDMWAGQPPAFEGKALHTSGRPLDFPVRYRVPILVAARGPKMLRVGAELADIVHIAAPFLAPTYQRANVELVRQSAVEAGRQLDGLEIDLTVSLSVAKDRAWARRVGRWTTAAAILWVGKAEREVRRGENDPRPPDEFHVPATTVEAIAEGWDMWTGEPLPDHLAELITDEILDQFTIAGEPDECSERLGELIAAVPGISGLRLKLPPLVGQESHTAFPEMIERIGEIISALDLSRLEVRCWSR